MKGSRPSCCLLLNRIGGFTGGKISTKTPDKRKICICSANTFLIRMSLSLTSHYSSGLADGVFNAVIRIWDSTGLAVVAIVA